MGGILSQDDIEDLLEVCGTVPTVWNSHGNMQVCCPVHGESNASMGVSSEKQVAHCFSCGFAGGFVKLLQFSQPDQFPTYKSAAEYIQFNYDVHFDLGEKTSNIVRYEDLDRMASKSYQIENPLPLYKIAPYKSGKETYKYFFKRGFDRHDMEEFMIGRDLVHKTVTIPCFYESGELAGVIGRYVAKNRKKNERYKVYGGFNRGRILYPVDKADTGSGTLILVEGCFDAIRMHGLGYKNTVAKMGVSLTDKQAGWIVRNCDRVINIGDNDERGIEGMESDADKLRGKVEILNVEYPDYGKDVCDWGKEDIADMLENMPSFRKIRRYEG